MTSTSSVESLRWSGGADRIGLASEAALHKNAGH